MTTYNELETIKCPTCESLRKHIQSTEEILKALDIQPEEIDLERFRYIQRMYDIHMLSFHKEIPQ